MRKKTEEKYRKICELWKAGKSRREIREEIHCCEETIYAALRISGEKMRRDSFENHQTEIVKMWQAGATLAQIEKETGLNISTINRHLLAMGMRRGSGWKPGRENQAPRKAMSHREQAEPIGEPKVSPRQYADNTRRSKTVVINGRKYQDVSAWYM